MTDEQPAEEPPGREPEPEPEREPESESGSESERRRLRTLVFGDVLPQVTSDERGDGESERESRDGSDEWFRRQVPPHHG